jgi:hypothetical protein
MPDKIKDIEAGREDELVAIPERANVTRRVRKSRGTSPVRGTSPLGTSPLGTSPPVASPRQTDREIDEITYLPEDGDPVRVKWNGTEFKAHVPVKISRKHTVLVPIRQERELPDGNIVSRAIERRVPMVELAMGNCRFMVNGIPPQQRNKATIITPETSEDYRGHALKWIMASSSTSVMDARWAAEEALRNKCGCDDKDIAYVRRIFEARIEALAESSDFIGAGHGMREVLKGLTPAELAMEASRRN